MTRSRFERYKGFGLNFRRGLPLKSTPMDLAKYGLIAGHRYVHRELSSFRSQSAAARYVAQKYGNYSWHSLLQRSGHVSRSQLARAIAALVRRSSSQPGHQFVMSPESSSASWPDLSENMSFLDEPAQPRITGATQGRVDELTHNSLNLFQPMSSG